jgi:hypothetical protein
LFIKDAYGFPLTVPLILLFVGEAKKPVCYEVKKPVEGQDACLTFIKPLVWSLAPKQSLWRGPNGEKLRPPA